MQLGACNLAFVETAQRWRLVVQRGEARQLGIAHSAYNNFNCSRGDWRR